MKLPYHEERYYTIPIHMIYSVKDSQDKNRLLYYIDIETKDCRSLRLVLEHFKDWEEVVETIKQQAMPGFPMSSSFVYKYKYEIKNYLLSDKDENLESALPTNKEKLRLYSIKRKLPSKGYKVYNLDKEFERQGITEESDHFRKYKWWGSNDKNIICGSYPKWIYVPKFMSDTNLKGSAMFRTKNRLPALSYHHQATGSSIWRSSQNKPGAFGSK